MICYATGLIPCSKSSSTGRSKSVSISGLHLLNLLLLFWAEWSFTFCQVTSGSDGIRIGSSLLRLQKLPCSSNQSKPEPDQPLEDFQFSIPTMLVWRKNVKSLGWNSSDSWCSSHANHQHSAPLFTIRVQDTTTPCSLSYLLRSWKLVCSSDQLQPKMNWQFLVLYPDDPSLCQWGHQELWPINQVYHLAERNWLQEYHYYYKAVTIAIPILIHGSMGVLGSKKRMGAWWAIQEVQDRYLVESWGRGSYGKCSRHVTTKMEEGLHT